MAHTPQASASPHARQASSPASSRSESYDDIVFERAAAQIRPAWSMLDRATAAPEGEPRLDHVAMPGDGANDGPFGPLSVHAVRPPDRAAERAPVADTRRPLPFGGTSRAVGMADYTAPKLTLTRDLTDGYPVVRRRGGSLVRWLLLGIVTLAGAAWGASESLSPEPPAKTLPAPETTKPPAPSGASAAPVQEGPGASVAEPPATVREAAPSLPTQAAEAPAPSNDRAAKRARARAARATRIAARMAARDVTAQAAPSREALPVTHSDLDSPRGAPAPRAPLGRAGVRDNPY